MERGGRDVSSNCGEMGTTVGWKLLYRLLFRLRKERGEMEVREEDVIINIDRKVKEEDRKFIKSQALLILWFLSSSDKIKVMIALMLLKLTETVKVVEMMEEEDDKSGGV